jgi:hypothetical protein
MKPAKHTIASPFASAITARNGRGYSCGSMIERSKLLGDMIVAISPRWRSYAAAEVSAGRLPRTMAYAVPSLTGGPVLSLGRGPIRRGMAFVGATHDGAAVGDRLPPSVSVFPVDLTDGDTEDEQEVVFDDFDNVGWPMIVVRGGAA